MRGPTIAVVGLMGLLTLNASAEDRSAAGGNSTPAAKPPAASEPAKSPPETAAGTDEASAARTAGYVTMATMGGMGLAFGALAMGLAVDKKSTANAHCDANKLCDQTGLDAVSAAGGYQTMGALFLAVGGVGMVIGLTVVLTNPKRSASPATLQPVVLPGGAGLSFGQRF
jgi:hypothetical protein